MSAFTGGKVLSELLGLTALWGVTYWKRLPQLHLGDASPGEATLVGGLKKSLVLRIAAAVALVLFQVLLVGGNANSRWAMPLVTIGVYALTRLTNTFDPSSPLATSLLSPTTWSAPKFDPREPMILPAISVATSFLLVWTDYRAMKTASTAFLLLLSGVGFFAALSRAARGSDDATEKTNSADSKEFIRTLAIIGSVFSVVLLMLVTSGSVGNFNLLVLFEVVLKAAQAFGLIMFASENAMTASSTITAAGVASSILEDSNMVPGLSAALAFSGSVIQVAMTAPKANDKKIWLFVLLFVPGVFLPILSNFQLAPSALKTAVYDLKNLPQTALAETHPVEKLHKKWTKQFETKLAGQSKTIEDAVAEYKRRYKRQPPRGFDKWFQLAQDNNYLLPDEFDTLMNTLEPFFQVSAADMWTRVHSAAKGEEIAEVEVINNEVTRRSWDHWHTDFIKRVFEKFGNLKLVPDFNLTLNALDEPRAVFGPAHLGLSSSLPIISHDEDGEETETKPQKINKNNVTWLNIRRVPLWPEIGPSCPNGGRTAVDDESGYEYSSHGINFMDAHSSAQDICFSESLRADHGFFIAPGSMKMTHNVVPIFSQAAPTRYGDILYPGPFYYNTMEDDIKDNLKDIPWEEKKSQAYWAGGSTGGYSTMENWKHIHRNRVSLLTNSKSTAPVTLLRKSKLGKWKPYQSWWGAIAKLFNVKVTRLVQCEEDACLEMERKFDLGEQPGSGSLGYKYNLDIDGNSYTGRYYRLLHSNAAVIKATIFREWHDDILTPWVHYIPLSNNAAEFGEMMRFLILEPEGDAIGKRIGASGKDWANRALTRPTMDIYGLRLFMEYGRLFDEDRANNAFYLDDDR